MTQSHKKIMEWDTAQESEKNGKIFHEKAKSSRELEIKKVESSNTRSHTIMAEVERRNDGNFFNFNFKKLLLFTFFLLSSRMQIAVSSGWKLFELVEIVLSVGWTTCKGWKFILNKPSSCNLLNFKLCSAKMNHNRTLLRKEIESFWKIEISLRDFLQLFQIGKSTHRASSKLTLVFWLCSALSCDSSCAKWKLKSFSLFLFPRADPFSAFEWENRKNPI